MRFTCQKARILTSVWMSYSDAQILIAQNHYHENDRINCVYWIDVMFILSYFQNVQAGASVSLKMMA